MVSLTEDELNQIDKESYRFSQVTEKEAGQSIKRQSKKNGRNSWIYLIKYLLK